ncbi:MAG: biotin--[acetyl-CoA-carboxylase] ligase [Chthoniobacter sp.]|nr:biotin--[acetyl-CoA-carboxylase] ligase [Chthoniobacter sp.]
MNPLDARLLRTLRETQVHLPAGDLAAQLGESVAAIRAGLAALNAAGFEIEDRPGFGFRLIAAPDRLIADDLTARLGASPLIREILIFAETESTNDIATRLGRSGAPGGVAIFAEHQTAGRGRFGRRWASASHRGLWFSLLLRPALQQAEWARLTTWAAVSVAAAIDETIGAKSAIKWPNDVFLADKKVAGILAESGADSTGGPFAVLGIGVNVNHEPDDFPDDLRATAGSLRMTAGAPLDRAALATAILRALAVRLPLLAEYFPAIIAEAGARSFLLGRWIQVRAGEVVSEGRAEELDENGHLLLRLADGKVVRLAAGEVTVIAR